MRQRQRFALALLIVLTVVGCGGPRGQDRFESEVIPVLESYCISPACHGVTDDAEARGEVVDWDNLFIRVRDDGTVADAQQAYDIVVSRINTVEGSEHSSLLRKPLRPEAGGALHRGGVQFADRSAPAYAALRAWIETESGGGEGDTRDALTENQRRFADDVLPHLAGRQCMNEACHGTVAPFTSFVAPIEVDGEYVFSVETIRSNYKAARVHISLVGDPMQSRLIRKMLPLDRGGIAHRGGNDIFFTDPQDPAIRAIAGWVAAERATVLAEEPQVTGIVFVRGPVGPEGPFDHRALNLGTDLYVMDQLEPGGELRLLTGSAHPAGPADVRDPTVRHDGLRIAFAMRTGIADGFNIYEIGVDGSDLQQLTADSNGANVQPTYGPDGRIYFTSTRAGDLADGFDVLDSEIWAVDPADGTLEQITYSPSPEITPSFIGTSKSYGSLAFTMRRTIGDRFEAPVFRMPLDHNPDYHGDEEIHIHHGVTLADTVVYAMRTMPDGRFATVLVARDAVWRAGDLAVFDRQFGPEVPRGTEDEAAVGGFRHAFSTVDRGLYRHPVPLPSGDVLVAHAEDAPVPDFGIYVATLEEDRSTGEPRLLGRTVLVDEPGVSEYDAEPIVVRPLEDDPTHPNHWDPSRTEQYGTLEFRHVETLEAIYSNLEQRGEKVLRDDLVYARLLEWVPVSEDELATAPLGLGSDGRTRILGEVPLSGGSLYLEVPADRPFRIQFLDADRAAVGTDQNRWIHVAPGESFPGGVAPTLYPVLCAGCHGGLSGSVDDVGGPVPDVVTMASVTMATHENLDPRRPLDAVRVDGEPVSVDFRIDVQPLLDRSCAVGSCHSGPAPAGELDLVAAPTALFDSAYEALFSYRGSLLERIGDQCPGDPVLDDDERLVFVRWVDLGALYRGVAP